MARHPRSPVELYKQALAEGGLVHDAEQAQVIARLDDLQARLLLAESSARRGGWWSRLRGDRPQPVRGLYIWGDTGRGKTWLVDLFHEALPLERKIRRHFHRFMAGVHSELAGLRGESDPLRIVADRVAERARLICFDEFFVSDIADAMLLGTLFRHLFERGVTLVATSNVPPDQLYRDGLQRARFLPAIELIQRHAEVIHMAGSTDYRLRALERAELYHAPLDDGAEAALERCFEAIAPPACRRHGPLTVNDRRIPTVRRADGVAWFEFEDLCDGPRSQADYIEIARSHHSVLLANVPQLDELLDNPARRFIALVDEFYDRNVKLVVSAAVGIEALYTGRRLRFEFRRTRSRLEEMQSVDYLAAPHLP
jgi:cell division protein ZapE